MFLDRTRLHLPGLLGGALLLLGGVGDAAGFGGCAHHGSGHAAHASYDAASPHVSSGEPLEHAGNGQDGRGHSADLDEHDCDGHGCDCDCPFVCVGSAAAEPPPSGAAVQAALPFPGDTGVTLAVEAVERHHPRTLPYFIPYSQAPPARS